MANNDKDDLKDFDLDSVDDNLNLNVDPNDKTKIVNEPITPNHLIAQFRLQKLLGRGGMGEVWLATDTQLERQVAIKLMRPEYVSNEVAIKRFQREARAIAKLNHPNIVQVYSIGWHSNTIYMVIELVEGDTLSALLTKRGKFSLNDAVTCLLQTVEGLSFAYSKGIVHRDIKPGNLMITENGLIKITDFGLAKLLFSDTAMTQEGTTLGSPNYMSPEQAKGNLTDNRSDIYSLGLTFYHLLTGKLPYTADTPLSVMLMQIQEPLPEPKELADISDGAALRIIKRMTAKDPSDRYADYSDLAADLIALAPDAQTYFSLSRHNIKSPSSIATKQNDSKLVLKPVVISLVGALILFFLGIGVYSSLKKTPQRPATAPVVQANENSTNADAPMAVVVPTALPVTVTPAVTAQPTTVVIPTKPSPTPTPTPTRTPITYTPIPTPENKSKTAVVTGLSGENKVPTYYDPQGKRYCNDIPAETEVVIFEDRNIGYVGILDPKNPKRKLYILKDNIKK